MCEHHSHVKESELEALKVLLAHWIKHNRSHEEGFREWVGKAQELGLSEVAEEIKKAADLLLKVEKSLMEAQKNYAKANLDH